MFLQVKYTSALTNTISGTAKVRKYTKEKRNQNGTNSILLGLRPNYFSSNDFPEPNLPNGTILKISLLF
jgi:hypothetical protein